MYSFLPKLSQQLTKFKDNPFVGPKEMIYENNRYYDVVPETSRLNEFVTLDDEQYEVIPEIKYDMSYNPTAGLNKRTEELGYNNPFFENRYIPGMNLMQKVTLGPETKPSINDMGGAGVMANTGPEPTPYLDQIIGNLETPYTMDYVPFASEEEMLRQTNPLPPYPLNPDPINIQTLDATGINNLAKNMPLPGAKQYPSFHGEYERMRQLAKDEAIVAEENKPKELPAFYGEYEKAKEQARKEYWQNYKPIEMPFTPFKGQIPNDINVENLAKNMPLPPGNTPTNTTNPLVQNPKNTFGVPEAYYLGKSMLDATALINNMVQPEPPSIQMKLPYFERQRLNPEPYDTMRSQMRDQGTQAYRLQRENISQASDLMKGLAAVTSGTQQGLMQVGMQQAGAEQQIQGINQQISAQEQAAQTELLNQENITNYQNKSAAQQIKDQMISAQLARLGDTAGAYSDYVVKKGLAQKMTDLYKEQADKSNAVQVAMLKYQAGQNELGSDAYKEAQRQNINTYISNTKTNLLADPRYSSLGSNYDPLTLDQRESKYKMLEQRLEILSDSHDGFSNESKPIEPVKTADMDDIKWNAVQDDYKRRLWNWESDKSAYDKYKLELDKAKPILELEKKFINELKSSYDITGKRQDFQSQWFKERGLKTMKEVIDEVESLINPNRQIFS